MKIMVVLLTCVFLTACPDKGEQKDTSNTNVQVEQPVLKACTKELKICPNGAGVGRNSENNCEFDPCPEPPVFKKGEAVMCTQEMKQCPDGTFVGRDSNKQCAFNPCPKDAANLQ